MSENTSQELEQEQKQELTISDVLSKLEEIKALITDKEEDLFSLELSEDLKPLNIPKRKYKYGLKFDRPNKPKIMKIWSHEQITLPSSVDLRNEYMPPVFDQGQLGSCTANALSGAFSYQYNVEFKKQFIPSRLFIYYNERSLEGTVTTDSGAAISDGVKVLETIGTCQESTWPYIISKFTVKPPSKDYQYALKQKVVKVTQIDTNVNSFKTALTNGYPVVFGFSVPATVENIGSDGFMPPYDQNNPADQILGGHAVCMVGYNDNLTDGKNPPGYFIVRNSWGTSYAVNGYFYMPYSFFSSNLISDCWVLDIVTNKIPKQA